MEKRTVIVTGGNSGLGYQCAKNIATSEPSYDKKAAKKLWEQSVELLKMNQDEMIL